MSTHTLTHLQSADSLLVSHHITQFSRPILLNPANRDRNINAITTLATPNCLPWQTLAWFRGRLGLRRGAGGDNFHCLLFGHFGATCTGRARAKVPGSGRLNAHARYVIHKGAPLGILTIGTLRNRRENGWQLLEAGRFHHTISTLRGRTGNK